MRTSIITTLLALVPSALVGQTDWPTYGHDAGATRYSPLKQINAKNVSDLQLAWTYDTETNAGDGSPRRASLSETTPLVVGNVMYMSTPYNRVVALEPETGKEIWKYRSPGTPAYRGIAYWPGDNKFPPEIVFGTTDGLLISLNAKTGQPVPGFGKEGIVNLREGVADKYPDNPYGLSSPPTIYHSLVITGSHTQESPSLGPSGDIRAWDMHNGKLVWTFHTVPRPGEPNHDIWQD
jgi:quinoprotein glucose dehydrogenase